MAAAQVPQGVPPALAAVFAGRTVAPADVGALAAQLGSFASPADVAATFLAGARGCDVAATDLLDGRVDDLLERLEEIGASPLLAARVRRALAREVAGVTSGVCRAGEVLQIVVDCTRPLETVETDAPLLRALLSFEGDELGTLDLPVCDGVVPDSVLADAICDRYSWPILGEHFRRTGSGRADWTGFLRELWGDPEADESDFYDERAVVAPDGVEARAALEVSQPLPELRVEWAEQQVEIGVGGAPLGLLRLAGPRTVPAGELRARITRHFGMELCRAAVRRALLGHPPAEAPPLRPRLAEAAAEARQAAGARAVLGRRRPHEVRASDCRRARLPAVAADDVLAAARVADEPHATRRRPALVEYAPDVLVPPGRERRGAADAEHVIPRARDEQTTALPVLMYHQVTSEPGPPETASLRVTPADFERQLRHLSASGFHGVDPRAWRRAVERQQPLEGKAVLLTFDDGYVDFLEHAWPSLERYGFTAVVFLVSGSIGATSSWDSRFGAGATLLNGSQIRALRAAGALFGSHGDTHRPLTGLPHAEVVREATRSRRALEELLDEEIDAFAYPFGDADGAVAHLLGACGYSVAFTTRAGRNRLTTHLLELHRIAVDGTATLDDFAEQLEHDG